MYYQLPISSVMYLSVFAVLLSVVLKTISLSVLELTEINNFHYLLNKITIISNNIHIILILPFACINSLLKSRELFSVILKTGSHVDVIIELSEIFNCI